jgi:N-acylneuraminate cytidylyltransferase
MGSSPRVLAVVLARGGSKGVPRKNIRPLGGVPLLGHTLAAAKEASDAIARTVVSTEDAEIAATVRVLGGEVIDRPRSLAEDATKSEPCLTHALAEAERTDGPYDAVMLLPPTCPFRTAAHIREAVTSYATGAYDTVLSLVPVLKYRYDFAAGAATPAWTRRANRQEREPVYLENGALYLAAAALVRKEAIFGEPGRIGGILMDQESSLNIDEPVDFDLAEAIVRRRAS